MQRKRLYFFTLYPKNLSKGEDFSQFACGSFYKNQRIPDDRTRIMSFEFLDEKLDNAVAGNLGFFLQKISTSVNYLSRIFGYLYTHLKIKMNIFPRPSVGTNRQK
jgi:hypothetical protein